MSDIDPKVAARTRIVLIVGFIILTIAYLYQGQSSGIADLGLPTTTPNTVGIFYDVTKITDGDTIHISMDGRDETIRLIGINTPETVDPRRPVECLVKRRVRV